RENAVTLLCAVEEMRRMRRGTESSAAALGQTPHGIVMLPRDQRRREEEHNNNTVKVRERDMDKE
ncbi:hypothetical protein F2P79_017466, partial [Pimephales promelas]